MGKAYTRGPLGRSGGACRRHHVDVGRAARDFTNPNTTTTTPDDLKCTNQPAAHQPLPPRSLNQLRRLLRPPTRDREEGRGSQGLRGIRNSADERGQPSPLPRSRPDVTAGAYQAPTGPTEPKWVRAAPVATLQHVGQQSRHHPHPPMPRHHHQRATPPHIGPPARSNPDGAQKGPDLGRKGAAARHRAAHKTALPHEGGPSGCAQLARRFVGRAPPPPSTAVRLGGHGVAGTRELRFRLQSRLRERPDRLMICLASVLADTSLECTVILYNHLPRRYLNTCPTVLCFSFQV